MVVANTLAYYNTAKITSVKSFIVQAPGEKKRCSCQPENAITNRREPDAFLSLVFNFKLGRFVI